MPELYGKEWQDAVYNRLAPEIEAIYARAFSAGARGARFGAGKARLADRQAKLRAEILIDAETKRAAREEQIRQEGVRIEEQKRQEGVAERRRQAEISEKQREELAKESRARAEGFEKQATYDKYLTELRAHETRKADEENFAKYGPEYMQKLQEFRRGQEPPPQPSLGDALKEGASAAGNWFRRKFGGRDNAAAETRAAAGGSSQDALLTEEEKRRRRLNNVLPGQEPYTWVFPGSSPVDNAVPRASAFNPHPPGVEVGIFSVDPTGQQAREEEEQINPPPNPDIVSGRMQPPRPWIERQNPDNSRPPTNNSGYPNSDTTSGKDFWQASGDITENTGKEFEKFGRDVKETFEDIGKNLGDAFGFAPSVPWKERLIAPRPGEMEEEEKPGAWRGRTGWRTTAGVGAGY